MGWFRRRDADSMDPQVLLARANATPPAPAPVGAGVASDFRMTVEDVFTITGRGTVVTGRVEAGTISTGSTIRLTRADGSGARGVVVTGIEAFRKKLDAASVGDNIGILLRTISKADVAPGDVLSG